jgi:hypothetical protein
MEFRPETMEAEALHPAESLAAVLSRMERLETMLRSGDGLAAFNRLYLTVARAVGTSLDSGHFADAEFLRRLEVNFANRYFEMLRRAFFPTEKAPIGVAWEPLLSSRRTSGISPERFALAGMHAHLNHELCLAIVRTCEERAITPEKSTPQHLDYQRLGPLWHAVLHGAATSNRDEKTAAWSCLEARQLAWDNAEVLWHLRSSAELTADYLSLLERNVVTASRTLLAPVI